MAITERLALLITADAQGAIREFDKMGTSAEKNIGRAEGKLDKFGSTMTSTGTKMIAGAAVIGAGMWQAGQSAADLEQAVGGTEAVFGAFTGTIDEFAAGAASAAGLSERAARELTSSMGAILQGFGYTQEGAAETSAELGQLGADLSATFGGKPEDAVLALGSALRGEFDPLERFGISLSAAKIATEAVRLGLAESTTEVDANAKAQAALALITEQSANAQGQFAREQGTTAGQMAITAAEFENAKAKLGEGFLPVMTKATQVGSGMIDMLMGVDSATGGMASTVLGAAVPVLGLGGVMSVGIGKAIEMRESFKSLAESGSKVGQWAAANSAALGGIGIALGAAAIAWTMYQAGQAEADAAAKAMGDTLDVQTGKLTENTTALLLNNLEGKNQADDLGRASVKMDEYSSAIEAGATANINWSHTMSAATGGGGEFIASLRGQDDAMSALIVKLYDAGELNSGLVNTLHDQSGAYQTANKNTLDAATFAASAATETDKLAGATAESAGAADDAAESQDDLNKKWDDAKKSLDDAVDAIDDWYGRLDFGIDATMAWEAAIDSQAETIKENGRAWNYNTNQIDLSTEAGRAVMEGYQGQRDVIADAGQAVLRHGGSTAEASAKVQQMTTDLRNQMLAAGYTGAQVDILIGQLGLLPDQINMIFNSPGLQTLITDVNSAGNAFANMFAQLSAGAANASNARRGVGGVDPAIPRRARGGHTRGLTLVGEEGPELAVFGGAGATIVPADQTARMMAGGGGGSQAPIEVVMNIDGREFYRKIVKPQMQSDIQGNHGYGGR